MQRNLNYLGKLPKKFKTNYLLLGFLFIVLQNLEASTVSESVSSEKSQCLSPTQNEKVLEKYPALLNVGAGIFNIVRGKKSFLYELDYYAKFSIYQKSAFLMRPMVGLMGTSKASLYLYAGFAFDTFFGKHLVITPSFAPGVYFRGSGKNLGYPLEFRSSIEVAYRFLSNSRLGMRFYHISNASIGDKNPGTECLTLYYSIPLNY